jgi:hypothetical protein
MNAQNELTVNRLATHCIACCEKLLARVNRARNTILSEFRETMQLNDRLLRLALNEAEALAWQTEYPHLLFPTLAQEKLQTASAWSQRQQRIRRAGSRLRAHV